MANTNAPYGFRNFGHRDGAVPTMGLERLFINSSDTNLYFTGDLVSLSSAAGGNLGPYAGSSVTTPPVGVFAGCEFFSPTVGRQVWSSFFPGNLGTSSSPCNAYIITDPDMQFVAQVSSGFLNQTAVGANIGCAAATSSLGSQTTGISVMTAASTSVASTSTLPFRIVDLYSNFAPPAASGINGLDNTTNFNTIVVAPNNWARHAGTTGTST